MSGKDDFCSGLLGRMTLEEKAGQLNLLHGAVGVDEDVIRRGEVTGYLLGPPRWDLGEAFSWAEQCNALQRAAVEESRLHIPLLFSRDVIHGHRSVFPVPLGQAASFDPELVRECARLAACEGSAQGVRWNYSPMVDIARDPRWGRTAEGYGEDPLLASLMAAAAVEGYQGNRLDSPEAFAACVKHFAAYGASQGGRDYDSVELSERTLREVYLPPFRAAVQAGAASIMSAIHDLNGIPMTINRRLLQDVLRDEWGFQGLIVSDWGTIADLLKHRVAADEDEAVLLAVHCGIEMDMVSGLYLKRLPALVKAGRVSMDLVDSAVLRVLQLKRNLGLFDAPYTESSREKTLLSEGHRRIARKAAAQSIVLLENRAGVLPLSPDIGSVAVVGPLAQAQAELIGCWSLDGRASDVVTVLDGVRSLISPRTRVIADAVLPDCAVAKAAEADVIIAVIGEHPARSGEAASVTSIELPPGQVELAAQLAQFGVPLIAVVIAGRPLVLEPLRRYADAVLFSFHPGIEGGAAIADVLFGRTLPCGKLPISFPRATGQIPVYYSQRTTGRPARREVRYSTRPIDLPHTPLYPFGYGLSYVPFCYSNVQVFPEVLGGSAVLRVQATVANCGEQDAWETAQLYIRDEVRSAAPPEWELKSFKKLFIKAAEEQKVVFELSARDLSFWKEGAEWIAEAGYFTVRIGPDSGSGPQARFMLADTCRFTEER